MSGAGDRELGWSTRPALEPQKLKGMAAGLCLAAFSSVEWLMKALNCTEEQAREFKANAQHDFEMAIIAARRAKGL